LLVHAALILACIAVVTVIASRFAPWEVNVGNLVLRSQRGTGHTYPPPANGELVEAARRAGTSVREESRPRNIVLVIGDGMGIGQVSTASALLHGPRGGLILETAPVTGFMATYAGDRLVTDSAASATAMATGFKVPRKAISVLTDGREPVTVFEAARAAGMVAGALTTSVLVDATPAGFTAHETKREHYAEILDDMLSSGTELLMGGDGTGYKKTARSTEYQEKLAQIDGLGAAAGYHVIRDEAGLATAAGPVLAVFPPREKGGEAHGPDLTTLSLFALEHLDATGRGFILLIESEVTDSMGHDNDIAGLAAGIRELDAAVAATLEWAEPRGDTLIVVTADHDTGGLGITDGLYSEDSAEVRWATDGHLAQWVPVFAFGPGAEHFAGVIDNTDIAVLTGKLLGLENFPRLHP
jgi:alkaline phosphatase